LLDRELLVKILGMAGSLHDGEALAAVRKAYALIRDAETTWEELLQPFAQLEIATEAAQQLYEENEALRRVATATPSAAGADWQIVGNPPAQAQWALGLFAAHRLHLNIFEEHLLEEVAASRGALTPMQQRFFPRVFQQVCERCGEAPPL
jgi:hypothetical protein